MDRIQSLLIKRGYIAWKIFLRKIKAVIGEFNVSGKFLRNIFIQGKKSKKIFAIDSVLYCSKFKNITLPRMLGLR